MQALQTLKVLDPIGHWHPKHTRMIAALANGEGGVLEIGNNQETPRGFKSPKLIMDKIFTDIKEQLSPCPLFEIQQVPKSSSTFFIQITIPGFQSTLIERFGITWISLQSEIIKCPKQSWYLDFKRENMALNSTTLLQYFKQKDLSKIIFEDSTFQLFETSDGSTTLYRKDLDETYHSKHGSRRESEHVFIQNGLLQFNHKSELSVLEIGFGTGLNALLSHKYNPYPTLNYTTLEPFPIQRELLNSIQQHLDQDLQEHFQLIHQAEWNTPISLNSFTLHKMDLRLEDFSTTEKFDLVYFDAFAPNKQADIWSTENFLQIFKMMKPQGLLVSYCSQKKFQHSLKEAGFIVEIIPGPPGKREMVRAFRP